MHLYAHITYNGTCEEAFRLYEQTLGGKIVFLLHYADAPTPPSAPDLAHKVAHATFKVAESTLSGADVAPSSYKEPHGFAIQLNLDSLDDATRIYEALSSGGHVLFPLQNTFWADRYAHFTDRFGTPWELNCSAPK